MNRKLISGLMALQLTTAITVSAQTYTFKVGSPEYKLRVADHIGGEELDNSSTGAEQTLEAYNLDLGGQKFVGLVRFEAASGSLVYATHYTLPNTTDYLKVLKGYQTLPKKLFLVAEKVADDGTVKSPVLLQYGKDDGIIGSAIEFPALPDGLQYTHVFDVMENFAVNEPIRILCTATTNDGYPQIIEILYNPGSGLYNVHVYKELNPPKAYPSVHYVRSYHYGSVGLTEPSFYGLIDDGKDIAAFCYYNNTAPSFTNTVYEKYHLSSINGIKGITGVQMNGSYGDSGNHYRIEMAFTDNEGGICIQQKDEMVTTNWQRFYQFQDKAEYRLGWGRDGHGTKMGPGVGPTNSYGYFLGAWMPANEPDKSQVTALHFNGTNGDLAMPRQYDITGKGIFDNGSFPSTCYDPGYFNTSPVNDYVFNYTFIADDVDQSNVFHFGSGNTFVNGNYKYFCSTPIKIEKARDKRLSTEVVEMYDYYTDPNEPHVLEPKQIDIDIQIAQDCEPEHVLGEKPSGSNLTPTNDIKLGMDPKQIRIEASNKEMASVQIFSIDGRSMATMENVGSLHLNHQFNKALVPGIYIVQIVYTDRSKEVRKVSIY